MKQMKLKMRMQNLSVDTKNWTLFNWLRSESHCTSSIQSKRNRIAMAKTNNNNSHNLLQLTLLAMYLCFHLASTVNADELSVSTTPLTPDFSTESGTETITNTPAEDWQPIVNVTQKPSTRKRVNGSDSILLRFARSFSSGNELWDGIIRDCYKRPDMSCFQKNVYSYLDGALSMNDVNVTQRLKFYKNQVQYEPDNEIEEEIPNEGRSAPETPIEEVSNALYGKTIKFAMTHDVEVQLPEIMFNGATFRISPRSIEGNGVIAKLELIPKQMVQARLLGMIKKKIDKFLRNKLLLSFIALALIIKIIKIKLFWLLPIVIGVGAAKKLLLKFLLFLFPALSHLFKLCSYYQQSYHGGTKYHHHHHLINHHHTVVPPWHSGEHHSVPEIIYTHPPKGHPSAYLHGAPVHETYGPGPGHEHFEGAWENSGPGLGSDSRPAFSQHNPVYAAGPLRQNVGGGLTAAQIAAQYEPPARSNQPQQQPQQQEPQLSPQLAAQLKEAIRIQAEQRLIQQQQQILEHQPFVQDGQPLYPLNYDPFYSPILLKIDKIIEQLGVKNDLCKERIVCNMYKDPATYSPHSNFISAELSRDTNELEPVTHANEAVRRFYRLIQAARDGQEQKDCQILYPQCNMQT
ncbi:uncharacterized protein LOC133837393 isoform X2 [Drosophila sulfurigaster albostrigata]|uniref:uncharacterized protein LOC133837393 isoform X2 n=1 Tax=Drosophila sulfurigaster albostrigata TaxID=89887 RepID=UPI002D219681|nr:uncharacterized protein LOC133837393 isoform X2 [Drosophila sulfurigaster albostrigata]